MRTMMKTFRRGTHAAMVVAAVGASAGLAGCGDFLEVTNPGAIENPALENPEYVQLMVDGVLGDFQPAFAWTALFSGVFADELRNHHGYFENGEIDRREVGETNGTYALSVFNGLHRTRFLADSVAGRLDALLSDSAGHDLRVARVLAYGGYAWTLLGEQLCETRINATGEPLTSEQLLRHAIERFDRAMAVASAARTAAAAVEEDEVRAARIAGADSIANFARIGAARAALGLAAYDPAAGPGAAGYAGQVVPAYVSPADEGFEFHAHYRDGNSFSERRRIGNPYWEFVTAGRWFSVSGTPFEGLDDPRVPHDTLTVNTADGTARYVPNSSSAFSTYDGTAVGAPFEATSSIRIASALEARYIVAEVEGLSTANLDFVNERRAIGGQPALAAGTTEAEYLAALRDQRRRDFFLDGHRLGDLRRYKQMYGVDEFPSGPYFDSATTVYGSQECWPVPSSEMN